MKILRIDHLGVAVNSIEESLKFWTDAMGLASSGSETLEEHNVKTAFLPIGDSEVELLESTSDDSPVARFIKKRGQGMKHIAFAVENIEEALEELKEKGMRLINETPSIGAGGKKIAFLHPENTGGILVEICQSKEPV